MSYCGGEFDANNGNDADEILMQKPQPLQKWLWLI